ncbi:hypothetical protein LC55x_5129 [Lysobacter capsici]|nr:hypothetical protein LC55x_5129 [Lysobacter capsici]
MCRRWGGRGQARGARRPLCGRRGGGGRACRDRGGRSRADSPPRTSRVSPSSRADARRGRRGPACPACRLPFAATRVAPHRLH